MAMWPMSHALYPGLNEEPATPTGDDSLDRSASILSTRTWYGVHRGKSVVSHYPMSPIGHKYSVVERNASNASYASRRGEDLGSLIRRSRQALSVLSEGPESEADAASRRRADSRLSNDSDEEEHLKLLEGARGDHGDQPEFRAFQKGALGRSDTRDTRYTASTYYPDVPGVPEEPEPIEAQHPVSQQTEQPATRKSSISRFTRVASIKSVNSTFSSVTGLADSLYAPSVASPDLNRSFSARRGPTPSPERQHPQEYAGAMQPGQQPIGYAEGVQPGQHSQEDVASIRQVPAQEPHDFVRDVQQGQPGAYGPQFTAEPHYYGSDQPGQMPMPPSTSHTAGPAQASYDGAGYETDAMMDNEQDPRGYTHTRSYSFPVELGPTPPGEKGHESIDVRELTEEEGPGPQDVDPSTLLTGLPLILVTVALSAAVFLVAMDVNVIATAIPRITGEFRSLDDVGWYGSAFLMATCATQVPFGRVYTLFPAKWVFVSAIFIFMIGSLVAALSPNSPVLILGRAVQGVGTSGILSGGLIIMSQVVALRLRPMLTGVIGAMEGVAMISAPIIGGVLTDKLHWRWCFYINLPIGGFVLLVVLVCLRVPKRPTPEMKESVAGATFLQTLRNLDLWGAVTLLPPIVCTLLALHYAGNGRSWDDMAVILLFVLAVVLFAVFFYFQHVNADVAMLPFRILKQRAVLSGFWFILCISSALVVMTYFLPIWFQVVKGSSAQESGIGIVPMLVAVIVGVVASGALVSLVGYYTPFMIASAILMPVGIGLLTTLKPDTGKAALIAFPAIFGLGVGVGFQQPLIGVQASLPAADIPIGTTIVVFGQTFGAAIIIAVGESVFQNRLVTNIAAVLGEHRIEPEDVLGDGAKSIGNKLSEEEVPKLISAVNSSLTQTFYLALAMAALSVIGAIFIGWKSVKPKKEEETKGKDKDVETESG